MDSLFLFEYVTAWTELDSARFFISCLKRSAVQ